VRSAYTRLRDATFKIAVKRFPFSAVLNRSLVKPERAERHAVATLQFDSEEAPATDTPLTHNECGRIAQDL